MSAIAVSILLVAPSYAEEGEAEPKGGWEVVDGDPSEDTGGRDDEDPEVDDTGDAEEPEETDEPVDTDVASDTGATDVMEPGAAALAGEMGGFSCSNGASLQSMGVGVLLAMALLLFRW
jgi:hypothetical protein